MTEAMTTGKAKVCGEKCPGRVTAVMAGDKDDQRARIRLYLKNGKKQTHYLIQTLLLFKHESKFTEVYKSIGFKLSELNSH